MLYIPCSTGQEVHFTSAGLLVIILHRHAGVYLIPRPQVTSRQLDTVEPLNKGYFRINHFCPIGRLSTFRGQKMCMGARVNKLLFRE